MAYVMVNREVVQADLARLPAFDRGILLGESVCAVIRVHNRQPWRLKEHVDLLAKTFALPEAGFSYVLNEKQLARDINALCEKNETSECLARFVVTPGAQTFAQSESEPAGLEIAPTVTELLRLEGVPPEEPAEKLRLLPLTGYARRDDFFAGHKIGGCFYKLAAKRRAKAAGFSDAAICDRAGNIFSASRANIFIVKDNALITPNERQGGVLPGVMRQAVCQCAAQMGIVVYYEDLSEKIWQQADDCFLTSCAGGIQPVGQIGDYNFSEHEITHHLKERVKQKIIAETANLI